MNTRTDNPVKKKAPYKASTKRLRLMFASWLRQRAITNKLTSIGAMLVVLCGYLTYAAFNNIAPFANSSSAVIWMLNIDLVLIVCFFMLIVRRISLIWASRKKGVAGAKLHIRLIYIFATIAGIPAIAMTIFSAFFFLYSIHGWFSERVESAINESQAVAEAYLKEHQETIKADIKAMAGDLNRQSELLTESDSAMQQMLQTQSFFRNLTEAALLDSDGDVMFQTGLSMASPTDFVTPETLERARIRQNAGDEIFILDDDGSEDRLRALIKLDNYNQTYLYVSRLVDPKVLEHLEATRRGAREYEALQGSSTKIQIMVTSIYLVIALLLMSAAIWFALNLARRIVDPISDLISAAEKVGAGDLSARAHIMNTQDEFDTLARAFNRMTQQLQVQQNELVDANRMLDYRRRFTETVLGGVSTGVISIDGASNISLINSAARSLLMQERDDLTGRHVANIMPEAFALVEKALSAKGDETIHDIIEYRRGDGAKRFFRVSVSIELVGEGETGAIITFDDITDIQIAQRRSAWADVARRIAHEIKNPLTPIQLSTERLRRRYLKNIEGEKDREVFSQCTDTIIKHVDDIKNMVNAFSNFAKMPDPVFVETDFKKLVNDIYVMQKEANNKIEFAIHDSDHILDRGNGEDLKLSCDEQQIRQCLTNLIQNAVDALEETDLVSPRIGIYALKDDVNVYLGIADNGEGIPSDILAHITEPYVTNKKKGTGLGLAIVKKIIEDHGGELYFSNEAQHKVFVGESANYGGAHICFQLPLHKHE